MLLRCVPGSELIYVLGDPGDKETDTAQIDASSVRDAIAICGKICYRRKRSVDLKHTYLLQKLPKLTIPTLSLPKVSTNSRYFWLERVLMGEV